MMANVVLAALFLLTTLVQSALLVSLPAPWAYTPFTLLTGLLVLHRHDAVIGAIWIALGGLMLDVTRVIPHATIPSLVAAAIAVLATHRVFATRSVYALLGLAASTGVVYVLALAAVRLVAAFFGGLADATSSIGSGAVWTVVLLVAGIYALFVVVTLAEAWFREWFVIRL